MLNEAKMKYFIIECTLIFGYMQVHLSLYPDNLNFRMTTQDFLKASTDGFGSDMNL